MRVWNQERRVKPRKYGRAYRIRMTRYINSLDDTAVEDWLCTSSLNRKVRGR